MMADMFNEVKEFVVAVGTEALKERGEKVYNEKKIKNELMKYAGSELKNFENIDRNCEIDFGYLKVYLTERLMGDFKEALYGESDIREQRKASILERLYSCTQADTNEKKQYVSRIFMNACDIIEKYYETQVIKFESLYLANKVTDEIHRDIKQCTDATVSLSEKISSLQDKQPAVSMAQYGNNNQQIGQVSSLTINNN